MPYPLPILPTPHPRETLPSFLSRFAAMNAASTTDFAVDLGFQFKRFLNLKESALTALADSSDLGPDQLQELISWTGEPIGGSWMAFRGESFASKAVRNPTIRGCPVCLREGALAKPEEPLSAMVMRGDWLLREVSLCCRHDHPLVPLWENRKPAQRFDIALHLRDLVPRIMAGDFDRPPRSPSPYDRWLDERLESAADPTWLANHSLFAATTMCRLLGTELHPASRPKDADEADQRSEAQAAGFAVLAEGEDALRTTLRAMANRTTGGQIAPRRAFGKFYAALDDYLSDACFDAFRRILRDCILETWPIAVGDVVLGQVLHTRQLHTPRTAAQEMGVTKALATEFLIEAGALPEDDHRPPSRQTFDALAYADLLAEIPTLVGATEFHSAIGVTDAQLKSLRDDGVLEPRTTRPKVKAPWSVLDGVLLVEELTGLSDPVPASDDSWEGIQYASNRTGLRVGEIIGAVRGGRLRLGRDGEVFGYRSFVVQKSEMDKMVGDQPHVRRRAQTLPAGQPASTFAYTVGLRAKGVFPALFAAGHINARWVKHPVTGADVLYMTEADMAAFHRRFLTPPLMQKEFGHHRQTCTARLRAAGVTPFAPEGHDFGPLYERDAVEPELRGIGS